MVWVELVLCNVIVWFKPLITYQNPAKVRGNISQVLKVTLHYKMRLEHMIVNLRGSSLRLFLGGLIMNMM